MYMCTSTQVRSSSLLIILSVGIAFRLGGGLGGGNVFGQNTGLGASASIGSSMSTPILGQSSATGSFGMGTGSGLGMGMGGGGIGGFGALGGGEY